jgi:hypothetical protein
MIVNTIGGTNFCTFAELVDAEHLRAAVAWSGREKRPDDSPLGASADEKDTEQSQNVGSKTKRLKARSC